MSRVWLPNPVSVAVCLFVAFLDTTATAAVIWKADFEDKSLAAFQQKLFDRHISFVSTPTRTGSAAARIELQSDDRWDNGLRRCELGYVPKKTGLEGSEHYYAWSAFIPEVGGAGQGGHDDSIAYWESDILYRVAISFSVRAGRLSFNVSFPRSTGKAAGQLWRGPFAAGMWHDLIFHVIWSSDPTIGLIELWVDGAKVVDKVSVQTMHKENGILYYPFFRSGILHGDMDTPPEVIVLDSYVDATTLEDAALGRMVDTMSRDAGVTDTAPRIPSARSDAGPDDARTTMPDGSGGSTATGGRTGGVDAVSMVESPIDAPAVATPATTPNKPVTRPNTAPPPLMEPAGSESKSKSSGCAISGTGPGPSPLLLAIFAVGLSLATRRAIKRRKSTPPISAGSGS